MCCAFILPPTYLSGSVLPAVWFKLLGRRKALGQVLVQEVWDKMDGGDKLLSPYLPPLPLHLPLRLTYGSVAGRRGDKALECLGVKGKGHQDETSGQLDRKI